MAQVEDAQLLLKSTDLWSSALYLLHDDDDVIELKKTEASMHEKVKKREGSECREPSVVTIATFSIHNVQSANSL